jgi:hypothetical protein
MAKLAQIGDAAPCRGHTEWSTDLLELGQDPKWRRRRPHSNASKNALFWCRMRELWSKQWRRVCWIRGWRGSWVGDELQLGEDHSVGVSSIAMSSSSSPSWIRVVLDSILAMSSSAMVPCLFTKFERQSSTKVACLQLSTRDEVIDEVNIFWGYRKLTNQFRYPSLNRWVVNLRVFFGMDSVDSISSSRES